MATRCLLPSHPAARATTFRPTEPSSSTRARHVLRAVDTKSTTAEAGNPWAQPGYLGAAVSSLPEAQQKAAFAAIATAIGAGTVLCASTVGPAVSAHLPDFLQVTSKSWFPLGPIFLAAGVAHFTEQQGFKNMYPHQGAWGFWSLPGSDKFHVQWTGVAEILGGLGMCIGALPLSPIPSWLCPTSALGLFFLTAAVTPANIYMYTHNAPGPLPESAASEPAALPLPFHLFRGVMQMVLLALLWGIATASR